MKNIKVLIIGLLSFTLLFTSCRKDQDEIIDTPILNEGEILGSITGQVIDESNMPIENATVFLKDDIQITDENGFFLFKDKALKSSGTVVKVQSPQYIEVSKIVNPISKVKTIVNIKLLDKKIVGTIDASRGGTVQVEGGGLEGQIDFPENAFVLTGSATPYTGSVQIFGRVINPANDDDLLAIPGDLRATDSNNDLVQLVSYSMIGVSLETSDGRKLALAEDKEATISFPIDPSLQTTAPVTIPLWHYNIETGHWEEEGSAELINNQYKGKVSHFSFWNCDYPFPLVQVSGRVVNKDGIPLANITIKLSIVGGGLTTFGATNLDGEFSGGVPKDENLEISFSKNYDCDNFSTSQNLGIISDDVDLGDILINLEDTHFILGRLLSCEGEVVQTTDAYIHISSDEGNTIEYSNQDGFFNIPICNLTNFKLIAANFVSGFKSDPIHFESGIEEDTNIGDVLLCSENETYFIINYEGELYKNNGAIGRLSGMQNLSLESDTIVNHYFSFNIDLNLNDGAIIGKHKRSYTWCGFLDNGENYIDLACNYYDPVESCNVSVEIITAEPFGGYITGSFEGTLINIATNETNIPVSGSFKVLSTL